jgi:hypothetical protein
MTMSDKSEETGRKLPAYNDAELANSSVSELLERMVTTGTVCLAHSVGLMIRSAGEAPAGTFDLDAVNAELA